MEGGKPVILMDRPVALGLDKRHAEYFRVTWAVNVASRGFVEGCVKEGRPRSTLFMTKLV